MASRLTTAQLRRTEAADALAVLEARSETIAADTTLTDDAVAAHVQSIRTARAALDAATTAVANEQALVDLAREAKPVAGVRTAPATVTPRFEQDPKWGFRNAADFATSVRAHQLYASKGVGRPDPRINFANAVSARAAAAFEAKRAEAAAQGIEITDSVDSWSSSWDLSGGTLAAAPSPLHQEGHSEDGIMVPPDIRREIWTPVLESDELVKRFKVLTTESPFVMHSADESTPWGANGIKAYWGAEAGTLRGSAMVTKPRMTLLHKLHIFTTSTNELIQDTALFNSRLTQWVPMATAWTIGEAIMRGDGTGKPLGWEKSPALVTITKETNQAAATIYPQNITKMYARMLAGAGSSLFWLGNRDIVPSLVDMKLGNEPSWVGRDKGLQDAPRGSILGDPIEFSHHCETLGTAGDLQYINASGYALYFHSAGTQYETSIHLYFDMDLTAYRWTQRIGGSPYLSAPVSPNKGTNTLSHFLYIATRA